MRVLLGIILRGIMTVGGAYLYVSIQTAAGTPGPATMQTSLVNWDVVGAKWQQFTERVRSEWSRHPASQRAGATTLGLCCRLAADLLALAHAQRIGNGAAVHTGAIVAFDQQWNAAALLDMARP